MSLDIKMNALEPRRHTYGNIARRLGEDRPASRYDEAVMDVQADANFHYRPLWAPEYELFDPRRTAIELEDWYVLRDPRQYYYATYNIKRADMSAATEKAFKVVADRGLLDRVDAAWTETVKAYLLPLRHYEWGANLTSFQIADEGFGTAITSAAAFCAADRLGMAQIIGRVGLELDGYSGDSLAVAKTAWMDEPVWQGLRHAVEDVLVTKDWFEVFVAQHFALDGFVHPLVFQRFDDVGYGKGGAGFTMLTEFMGEWWTEEVRWVDSILKAAASASPDNAATLGTWAHTWIARAAEAAAPLATSVLGDVDGASAIAELTADLRARATAAGLTLPTEA